MSPSPRPEQRHWLLFAGLFFSFITLVPLAAVAEEHEWLAEWLATAQLDQEKAFVGDDVILRVEVSEQLIGIDPELEPLTTDFAVLGMTSGAFLRIQDDRLIARSHWTIHLQTKNAGEVTIPSLKVGHYQTQTLNLTVLPGSAKSVDSELAVFIETAIDPPEPYVQAQLRYTVRIIYSGKLIRSRLEDFTIDGASIIPLEAVEPYPTQQNGETYQVKEWHFAIFPEHSGLLKIPVTTVEGRLTQAPPAQTETAQQQPRSQYFQLKTKPLNIDVQSRPEAYRGRHWLPAEELDLQSEWPDSNSTLSVGEPVRWILSLSATGLHDFHLPEFTIPLIEHAQIYPGPVETETFSDQNHVFVRRNQAFTLVPTQPGLLQIPPITLDWWDNEQQQQSTASIPAQSWQVLALNASESDSLAAIKASTSHFFDRVSGWQWNWQWFTIFLLILWLTTLYGWWQTRRFNRSKRGDRNAQHL